MIFHIIEIINTFLSKNVRIVIIILLCIFIIWGFAKWQDNRKIVEIEKQKKKEEIEKEKVANEKKMRLESFNNEISLFDDEISRILIGLFGNDKYPMEIPVTKYIVSNFENNRLDYLIKYFGLKINSNTINLLNDLLSIIKKKEDIATEYKYWVYLQYPEYVLYDKKDEHYESAVILDIDGIENLIDFIAQSKINSKN